jgi:hypothetical protein
VPVPHNLPRLTRDDVQDIKNATEDLNGVAVALTGSTWVGRGPCLAVIARTYELLARLYNRSEEVFVRGTRPYSRRKPRQRASEAVLDMDAVIEPDNPQVKAG